MDSLDQKFPPGIRMRTLLAAANVLLIASLGDPPCVVSSLKKSSSITSKIGDHESANVTGMISLFGILLGCQICQIYEPHSMKVTGC